MAKDHSIASFPSDIDRDNFGHWLSGFTDGEGCFGLQLNRPVPGCITPRATFKISLRYDDAAILHLIQSYLNCGRLHISRASSRKKHLSKARKDCLSFDVTKTSDLTSIIIPHFEKYTLRAKKQRDFDIWKQGAIYIHQILMQKRSGQMDGRGRSRVWNQSSLDYFGSLIDALWKIRQFDPIARSIPSPEPLPPTLFDLH